MQKLLIIQEENESSNFKLIVLYFLYITPHVLVSLSLLWEEVNLRNTCRPSGV